MSRHLELVPEPLPSADDPARALDFALTNLRAKAGEQLSPATLTAALPQAALEPTPEMVRLARRYARHEARLKAWRTACAAVRHYLDLLAAAVRRLAFWRL